MFERKLSKRSYKNRLRTDDSTFASVSIPSEVISQYWSDVSSVVMTFDPILSVLLVTPVGDNHAD
jgi:hypothetical protein